MRILFVLYFLIQSVVTFAGTALILNHSSSQINLKDYCYHIEDHSNNLTIHQTLKADWSKFSGTVVFPANTKIQWIRYDISNPYNEDIMRVIFLPYHHINEIDVYTFSGSTIQNICKTGTKRTQDNKHIKSIGYPIKVNFPAGKTTSVILKLKHLYRPLHATSFLMTSERTYEVINKNHTLIWFWRGVFLFALGSSIVLFWFTRLRIFLYYFFTNLGFGLFFASQIGDYFLFFDVDKSDITTLVDFSGNFLAVCFLPLFLNSLTPIKKRNKLVWKWMFRLIYFMIPLYILSVFPQLRTSKLTYFSHFYFMITAGLVLFLQPFLLIKSLVYKDKNAIPLLFIYGFFIFSIFTAVIIPNMGFFENSPLIHNKLVICSFVEIFCFMFLIGSETLNIYKQRAILLEKQKGHQREMILSMIKSQEDERDRVGRDLHDLIGANMALIKQKADQNDKELVAIVKNTIESVRRLSHGLVTPMVKGDEFVDEIKEMCHLFTSSKMVVYNHFYRWPKIPDVEINTHLYRITQELLQNAVKHSRAKNVYLHFFGDSQQKLSFTYEDDGIGFNDPLSKGIGLKNIQHRIAILKGSLRIESSKKGKGTMIIIEI